MVDRKGQAVRGLTKNDFVVTENGVPQTVTSFEAVAVPSRPTSPAAPVRPRVSTNLEADTQRGRPFVVVFDDIHLSPVQATARGAWSSRSWRPRWARATS